MPRLIEWDNSFHFVNAQNPSPLHTSDHLQVHADLV